MSSQKKLPAFKNGSNLSKAKILKRLKDDEQYYGDFGKQFLSNSVINKLINNPASFTETQETTLPMVQGRYLHTSILEPHKLDQFNIVDSSSRRTKKYTEEAEGSNEPLLLTSDVENLLKMKTEILRLVGGEIISDENDYEVPEIGVIAGRWWKGKADVLTPTRIIDIKTTADISKFERSAYNYGYNTQAFIYRELFGVPMEFIAVDKKTFQVARFTCSEDFYESGMKKMALAVKQFNKFYGEDAYEDVRTFVPTIEL